MKAKSFYKNNKHNNMDPKEKENINEEELKSKLRGSSRETEEIQQRKKKKCPPTEEEKLAQELEKATKLILKTRKTRNICASPPSSTTTVNAP